MYDAQAKQIALRVQQVLRNHQIDVPISGVIVGPAVIRVELGSPKQIKSLSANDITRAAIAALQQRNLPVNGNTIAYMAARCPRVRTVNIPIKTVIERHREIALALQAPSVRIDQDRRGLFIEIPRRTRDTIEGEQIFAANVWQQACQTLALPLCLGVDIYGNTIVTDLAAAPHALVAGTTGSGKSNTLHSIVASLAQAKSPDDLELHLIDMKGGVEFTSWEALAHLHDGKIVYTADDAVHMLRAIETKVTTRYEMMRRAKLRTFSELRERQQIPYVVIIIDEIASLMTTYNKIATSVLVTLSQTARSAGVHFVICTQRPSADIISGSVTANYPLRVAHAVSTAINSRVIGVQGAETLLGKGDALIKLPDHDRPVRAQVPYIRQETIERIKGHT